MSRHEFLFDDEPIETNLEKKGDAFSVSVGDKVFHLTAVNDSLYRIESNGETRLAAAVMYKGVCYIDIDSLLLELKEPSEDGPGGVAGEHGAKDRILAPMPGKIVKIMVAVGDEVTEKQALVIVEAMKMENTILSKANGRVKAVHFAAGDQVDAISPIIELEIDEEA
jgi:biotin carboxyl carrier protein